MNGSPNTRAFSAADIADTGLWRLILLIGERGMSACLRNTEMKTEGPIPLFDKKWEGDPAPLLQKIENCTYDHPRLLDDYATEVIVQTPKLIMVPTAEIEEDGAETDFFNEIWQADPDDIMTDPGEETTAVYSLCPGLPSFLRRTLPGARTVSHLSVLMRRYGAQQSEMTRIYADIRSGEADIIAYDGATLLTASTQQWGAPTDVAYRIVLLMQTLGIPARRADIRLTGLSEAKSEVAGILRQICDHVVFGPEPAAVAETGMQLSMALAAER